MTALLRAREFIAAQRVDLVEGATYPTGDLSTIDALSARGMAEYDALLAEIDAEIAAADTADLFWDDNDPESSACDIATILSDYSLGEIVRVQRGVRLSDVFAVQVDALDDGGLEIREFDSLDEADAWLALRPKGGE